MKRYVLISLVLLGIALVASAPWFRERGTAAADVAFAGVISEIGGRRMIQWVLTEEASLEGADVGAETVLSLRTHGRRTALSNVYREGLFLGSGEDLAGNDTGFPAGREPRSVGAWIKTTSAIQPAIFNYGTEAPRQRFSLLVSGAGKLMFAGVGDDFEGDTTVNDGKWHFAVITYDGKSASLYVDGKLDGSRECNQSTVLNGSFEVGSVRGEFAFFTGIIHSVFVFNYVLPGDEIRRLARDAPSD